MDTAQKPLKEKTDKFEKEITEFLEYLEVERNVSPLTLRDYKHYLEVFANWANDNNIGEIESVDIKQIRSFRLFLSRKLTQDGEPIKRITQNYYVIALRAMLRFLVKNDRQVISPDKIELGKQEGRQVKFLTQDHLNRLLNSPNVNELSGLRDKAILEMLFSTGLRVSEMVSLDRDSIDLNSGEFGVMGKGRRVRVVFLSPDSATWVARYLNARDDHYEPLFVRYKGKKSIVDDDESHRLTSRSIQRIVEGYVKKARLPIKATPHTLRHSFATDLLNNGADIRSVQEMLGHKNIATTQIYTHVTNRQLREVHQAFHGRKKDKLDE